MKWMNNLFTEIELLTSISHLYQDNLSASKVIMKQTKTKNLASIEQDKFDSAISC